MAKKQPVAVLDDDCLLDAAGVARIYGVKPATVRAWLARKDPRLPVPLRFGRSFTRWKKGEVLERIEALRAGVHVLRC